MWRPAGTVVEMKVGLTHGVQRREQGDIDGNMGPAPEREA